MKAIIANTVANRKILREHAREALRDYSPVMTWVVIDEDGDLYEIVEPQGQTFYCGNNYVIAKTGGFFKSCGEGAARNDCGEKYSTQRQYLIDLLGAKDYDRLFNKGKEFPEFEGVVYDTEQNSRF